MKKTILLTTLLAPSLLIAQGQEGFEGELLGWNVYNQSSPAPTVTTNTNWRVLENSTAENFFPAHEGTNTLYSNFQATGATGATGGVLCNYVIAPAGISGTLTFNTRSRESVNNPGTIYPDRLHVRYTSSANETPTVGNCTTDFGEFDQELLIINDGLVNQDYPAGYPVNNWTEFSVDVPGDGSGRIAFVHYVTDAGINGNNSNLITLDSLSWTGPAEIPIFKNGFE